MTLTKIKTLKSGINFKRFLKIFIFYLSTLSLGQIIFAPKALAAGWWDTVTEGGLKEVGDSYGQGATPTELPTIIALIINVFLGFLGIIFVVLIIVAGFKWMTASGNEDKVNEAKSQLSTGVIGIVIILAAFAIARFVLNMMIKASTGVMPIW